MYASPVIPGFLYRVKGAGHDLQVIAPHGCVAICTVLELLSR